MMLNRPSQAASTMVLGAVLLVATTIFGQQLSGLTDDDATTARLVCSMIGRYHINHAAIDDTVSPRLLNRFVDMLDPLKLYFLKSDIDTFEQSKLQLDDQVKAGDVSFAFTVFNRYQQRVDERIALALKLVRLPHNFTIDEEMATDPDSIPWSESVDALNERWRRRVKFDILNLRLEDNEADKIEDRLIKRYNTLLRTIHETEPSEVMEMYLSSLMHCFDPHSSYMSPESEEEFRIQMALSLDGIGAALRAEDGYTMVADVVKGGAAERDGRLKVGDKITAVAQDDSEFVDIIEMKLSKVVRLIRGKRGSKVKLQVVKADTDEPVVYELIRQKIELTESEVKGEIIETMDRTGRKGRIGIINIPSFYRDFQGAEKGLEDFKSTARDVQKVLVDFRRNGGVDGIVIDLRYNGGGALSEAIEVTGLFINDGPVVQVKEPGGRVRTYSDEIEGAFNEPLVVVCNRMSASASEIFAGAIKDYRRGIVVGDSTTHGKGTVQNVMPVSPQMFQFFNRKARGALKLTINQFYRVNGASTQNLGVESDVVLPSLLNVMDVGESSLDNALAFDKIDEADHEALAYVNADLINRVKTESQSRVAKSADFDKVMADIARYNDRKNRKTITLNEEKLKQEREQDRSRNEEVEKAEGGKDKKESDSVFPKTPYNDELLQVALDYVDALRNATTAQR